ncbi:MAG: hypothetical protein JWN34_1796 [Bryobacterales bacterium]|nr:hypothetical protein [Bryobacterales bacterium]
MATQWFRLTLFVALLSSYPFAAAQGAIDYDREIRPILSENCFLCHGQDSKKRMAGLRLDTFEGATAVRLGGVALAPGKPESSLLYQRITSPQDAKRMPPASSNRNLDPAQIALLKRWIEEGGKYQQHWTFRPPVRPAIPATSNRAWVKQPIDAFVLQRLESEALRPSPATAPATWLRRVSLDLTGLPPSPGELDAFTKDAKLHGEAAWTAAVDRLLASPAYGERMAMDWLDVARYADTHGFNNDSERSMWRWRDWVVQSFNSNKPYDRFITEQLAGDLLPNPTLDQRIATGFGRNHVINSEGGIIEEEYRVEYVADRVRTLGMAWLGLTLECAHCHDHKFDPITQRDHYRFSAFFNNIAEFGEDGRVANAVPMISAPTAEQQRRMQTLESAIAKVRPEPREKTMAPSPQKTQPTQLLCEVCKAGENVSQPVPISKRDPFTFSAWLNPAPIDRDVALLSAIDYSQNPAAVTYGNGIEFRLVNGELELRFSARFPAYSMRVRSEGAGLVPGEWHHLTLAYRGAADKRRCACRLPGSGCLSTVRKSEPWPSTTTSRSRTPLATSPLRQPFGSASTAAPNPHVSLAHSARQRSGTARSMLTKPALSDPNSSYSEPNCSLSAGRPPPSW